MWALVESDNVTQVFTRPKGITIGEVNYPSNIFMLWTASELEALGIYEIVIDNTNLKDKEYYINTNQSFDFADGVVTASYGVATAKPLDDVLFTAQDENDGLGTEGELNNLVIPQHKAISTHKPVVSYNLQTGWLLELQKVVQQFLVLLQLKELQSELKLTLCVHRLQMLQT